MVQNIFLKFVPSVAVQFQLNVVAASLVLMLVLTFAASVLTFAPCILTFAPCTLTFAPCACGVILLSTTPLAHIVVVTGCNLRWWPFILQSLALTLPAPAVVSLAAICIGGLFPYTHWHTYTPIALEQLALCGIVYIDKLPVPYTPQWQDLRDSFSIQELSPTGCCSYFNSAALQLASQSLATNQLAEVRAVFVGLQWMPFALIIYCNNQLRYIAARVPPIVSQLTIVRYIIYSQLGIQVRVQILTILDTSSQEHDAANCSTMASSG